MTVLPGHFAQNGPVLGHLVRAVIVVVQFALAGAFADIARAVSLPAHFAPPGPVGAFAGTGEMPRYFPQPVPGRFAQPVPRYLERAVRARPVPAHLALPPKLRIA